LSARRTGCGCAGLFWILLELFVLFAPAYYASEGKWPLGSAGALLAYILLALTVVAVLRKGSARRALATIRRSVSLETGSAASLRGLEASAIVA
jgi:hypothetical protein